MRILGFDSSGPVITVGAADKTGIVGRADSPSNRSKGNTLELLIDALLVRVGWRRADVQGLGVLTGPGSLTAMRIGWATAVGWAQSARIPVTGWTVPVAHQRWKAGAQSRALCCIHYRADTFLIYDLTRPKDAPHAIQLGEPRLLESPEHLTGPGVVGRRAEWSAYWGTGTEIAEECEAVVGGDTLALWARDDIAQGKVLSISQSPLEYGLPPDFKKLSSR